MKKIVLETPYNFMGTGNNLIVTCVAPAAHCGLVACFNTLENVSAHYAQTADKVGVCSLRLHANKKNVAACMPALESMALDVCKKCHKERVK